MELFGIDYFDPTEFVDLVSELDREFLSRDPKKKRTLVSKSEVTE